MFSLVLVGLCTAKEQSPPRLVVSMEGRTCQAVVGRWDALRCHQPEVGPPPTFDWGRRLVKGVQVPVGEL